MGANKWGLVAGLVGVAALGGAVGALVMKPAAPAGPSQAEVQALRAELSDLRTQLQRTRSEQRRNTQVAGSPAALEQEDADEVRGHVEDSSPRPPLAEIQPAAQPVANASMDQLFAKDTRDGAWASETEANVRTLVKKLFSDAAVEKVECRSSFCELKFRSAHPGASRELLSAARKYLGTRGGSISPGAALAGDARSSYVVHLELDRDED